MTERRSVTVEALAEAVWQEMEEHNEYDPPPHAAVAWAEALWARLPAEPTEPARALEQVHRDWAKAYDDLNAEWQARYNARLALSEPRADSRYKGAPGGVHVHGPEDGPGIGCREYLIGQCRLPRADSEGLDAKARLMEAWAVGPELRSVDRWLSLPVALAILRGTHPALRREQPAAEQDRKGSE